MNNIKIKLTTCATWRYRGRMYPGYSIVDIEPRHFDESFMVKVEEPIAKEILEAAVVITPEEEEKILPGTETTIKNEKLIPALKPKPKRAKKAAEHV